LTGPCQLSVEQKELAGHGRDYHADGFSSPVGKLKGESTPLEKLSERDLAKRGIESGKDVSLEFESGVTVRGRLEKTLRHDGNLVLMTFSNCTVARGDEVLFKPDWGTFDMAVGEKIVSVFAGAADKTAYQQPSLVPKERTVKAEYSDRQKRLFELYRAVRDIREGRGDGAKLPDMWSAVKVDYPDEWLLPLEILEIFRSRNDRPELAEEIHGYLEQKAAARKELTKLINDGLALLK
jgi:phenylalanine-4-hydroxylase